MHIPAGFSRFVLVPSVATLIALVAPVAALPAVTTPTGREAVPVPLPRYDPTIRAKYLADQAATEAAPRPAPTPDTPAPVPPPATTGDTLVLDPITVHANRSDVKRLPRITVFAPLHDSEGEPFESGSARNARLVRKYLGEFGQALSCVPFLGKLVIAGALDAERELQHTQALNGLADSIELAVFADQDPEITRKARAEYLKLFYKGPAK